jgi:transposase
MLPKDFPKWQWVYYYWRVWSQAEEGDPSLLERALKKSVCAARERQGHNASSTFLIVDAQSVKNTNTAGQKGYDAGKKVSGIKRPIVVDTQGRPHAIAVTTAEVTDRKGALEALERNQPNLKRVKSLLCDNG